MSIKSFFLFIFAVTVTQFGQSIFTPPEHEVYPFLERMSLSGIINYHDEVKPLSRVAISRLLEKILPQREKLNEVEKGQLSWFIQEFKNEMKSDSLGKERYFLYKYTDSLFTFRVSPIAKFDFQNTKSEMLMKRSWGVNAYSSSGSAFSMQINFTDNGEYGKYVDKSKNFTHETGRAMIAAPNGIEYSDVRGALTLDWGWGNASIQKDYVNWGHGQFGQLILSSKTPSFPMIRLELKPTDWLRFYYIHGWLNSLFVDSIGYYYRTSPIYQSDRQKFVKKYFVANLLSFTPVDWLDVSLGNSLVYKGDLRAEMFIPFMFFKYLDRDTGHGSIEDGNGALFSDFSVKYFTNYHLYASFFLDVTEIRNILKNDWHNTWMGMTFGIKRINFFLQNLDVTTEYTRINPWVYEHKDSTTTYKHLDYTLGHWIGQNADQIRIQFDYRFLSQLSIKMWFESLRKGGLDNISLAYKTDISEPFLYGSRRNETNIGLEVSYEYLHDLFGKVYYQYSNVTDEDKTRTPAWELGVNHSVGVSVQYGI